jgi:hypothetical protein
MLQRTIFTSDLAALSNGAEFKAALILYDAAYSQLPAGSLPSDDRLLSFLSRAGSDWSDVKAMALRGWTLCSDGRLYHRITAEKALIAWIGRLKQRVAAKAGGAKKNKKEPAADIGALQNQIIIALQHLARVAPDCRELSKWQRQSAGGSAGGGATGGAGGNADAVLMLCQGEGEGEGLREEVPSQNDGVGTLKVVTGGVRS